MKLIKASYEILTPINGEEILKQIELAARSCYQSEGKIEYDPIIPFDSNNKSGFIAVSARPLVTKLLKLGHEAMIEFGGMITVRFIVDRGVSHELVRHRVASFAQESTRYCNYGKDAHISFIIPSWCDIMDEATLTYVATSEKASGFDFYEDGIIMIRNLSFTDTEFDWLDAIATTESIYNTLLTKGWSPQQARSVLPNSLKTEINVSANIREWRHIFKQRTAKAAHPQMREVMCPLLDEFKTKIPILFDDINY